MLEDMCTGGLCAQRISFRLSVPYTAYFSCRRISCGVIAFKARAKRTCNLQIL